MNSEDFPPVSPKEYIHFEKSGPLRNTCILGLHGFSSTPYELAPLAAAIHREGAYFYAPLLAGHGTQEEDMHAVDETLWLQNAREAFQVLPEDRAKVVVGASMGGLLALNLAVEFNDVKALVLLAPALSFAPLSRAMIEVSRLPALKRRDWKKSVRGGDIASAHGRQKNPAYTRLSHAGMGALARLRISTMNLLSKVTCPILLIHGNQDHTIEPEASTIVAMKTNAEYIEHHRLPESFHVLGLDVDRHEIAEITSTFLERLV